MNKKIGKHRIISVTTAAAISGLIVNSFVIDEAIAAPPTTFSAVNMVRLIGETVDGPAVGASTLIRNSRGAKATISLGDLDGGVVHPVWALAFNNPEACQRIAPATICLPGADAGGDANLSIFWVDGGISSYDGVLNLDFEIVRHRPANVILPTFGPGGPALELDGLTNVRGAEIHFVVVPHLAAVPMEPQGSQGEPVGSVAWEMTHPGPATRGAVHLASPGDD